MSELLKKTCGQDDTAAADTIDSFFKTHEGIDSEFSELSQALEFSVTDNTEVWTSSTKPADVVNVIPAKGNGRNRFL